MAEVESTADDEAKLDQWVAAKRGKDYATADRIREELRAKGIEPDTARPAGPGGTKKPAPDAHVPDAVIDRLLDEWVAAKRAKDFATADRIRDQLRSKGVEPDNVRPAFPPPAGGHLSHAKLPNFPLFSELKISLNIETLNLNFKQTYTLNPVVIGFIRLNGAYCTNLPG